MDHERTSDWHFAYWLVLAVAAYVISFIGVLAFETIFGASIWRRFPDGFMEGLRLFYAPLVYLLERFLD
jgi:hypothetical protein